MKYAINAPAAPESIGPYSQGTTAGRLVFASGQLPIAAGKSFFPVGQGGDDLGLRSVFQHKGNRPGMVGLYMAGNDVVNF